MNAQANASDANATVVVSIAPIHASGLAKLAFGSASSVLAEGARHLAFLPPDALELDLSDPEQCDFGDYELIEQLGQGGMGVVYRARQRSLQREVALKLLAAGPWASPEFVSRFQREAQSAARLQHPNIVAIYEIGNHAELNFFSMALVRGQSLAQLLASGGPLPAQRAARLLRSIAEALDYAHRLGILHLDLKPANVLIEENGEPQVADFGLARRLDEALNNDSEEVSGTPSYMAPEQAQLKSHRISTATDIYGLGAILYELLTGRPPFLAANARATLEQVIHKQVRAPREFKPDIPQDLEAICLQCLSKDPQQRYLSARALADDLARFLDGRAVSVRPLNRWERLQRWAQREPKVAMAASLALAALLLGLLATSLQWRRADASAAQARAGLWMVRGQIAQTALATGDGFRALRSLIANLGEMETSGTQDQARLERQRIGTLLANSAQLLDLLRLPPGEAVTSVAIAPDATRFAVASHDGHGQRTLRQFDLASGELMWATSTNDLTHGLPFASGTPHGQLHYTADGSRLLTRLTQQPVFAAPSGADGIALDASSGRVLSPPDLPEAPSDLVYSGDARIALVRFRSERGRRFPDSGQFYRVEPWQALGPRFALNVEAAMDEWLPTTDGRWFLGTSDFCHFKLVDPHTLDPIWQLQLPPDDPVRAWRFNADASRLALGTLSGQVYLVDTENGRRLSLPASAVATIRWLEFSSDGRTLAGKAEDGTIVAWELPSLRPRTVPLSGGGTDDVMLRVVNDQLYSAAAHNLQSWTLPELAPFNNVATPAIAQLHNRRHFMNHAFDVHQASRLLIAAGTDGHIGIWRGATPALLPLRAAPLPARLLHFDGERVVAVDDRQAQLRDAITQAPRSAAFEHPEPVRLAELSSDGRLLVTIAGRTVRVLDVRLGTLVGTPVVLPQTPLRAELASQAPVLAVTTGEYVGDAFHERIHVIDLEQAARRPVAPVLPLMRDFMLDPQARYALVVNRTGREQSSTAQLVDLSGTGRACSAFAFGPGNTLVSTAIAADGRTAWSYLQRPQRRGQLLRWDLQRCTELLRIDVQQGPRAPTLHSLGEGVWAFRLVGNALTWFGADGQRRDLVATDLDRSMQQFALSGDGQRAAVAIRNAVQLLDLPRGERISGLLAAPIPGNDAIAKLAFSADATRLLARTVKGRWLHWQLPMNQTATPALQRLGRALDPDGAEPDWSDADFAALREQLRADAPARPAPTAETTASLNLSPVAEAQTDPRFVPLDLRPAVNIALSGPWPRAPATGGDRPTLAAGPQRLLDIDWRIDGGVQLSSGGPATALHPTQRSSVAIAVPSVKASRVHVLTHMHIPLRAGAPPSPYAQVILTDAAGRDTTLQIRIYEHVVTHWLPDLALPSARIGWAGIDSGSVLGGHFTSSQVTSFSYAVSLDVPASVGPIVGLRLATSDGPMEAPLFHAVTLERPKPDLPDAPE